MSYGYGYVTDPSKSLKGGRGKNKGRMPAGNECPGKCGNITGGSLCDFCKAYDEVMYSYEYG